MKLGKTVKVQVLITVFFLSDLIAFAQLAQGNLIKNNFFDNRSQFELNNADILNNNTVNLDSKSSNLKGIDGSQKFDNSLREIIKSGANLSRSDLKRVKVIILFDSDISKEKRVKIIESLFNDWDIIYNYNIIPGVCLECSIIDLKEIGPLLAEFAEISVIHESKVFIPQIIDPKLSDLNADEHSNWWLSAIGANNLLYDGSGVKVAVVDTGIYSHPGLNIVQSRNFVTGESTYQDLNGHGTHVAGIIGGNGAGSSGRYRGVASGVSLISARVGDSRGGIDESDAIEAIEWCTTTAGANIISMSFGSASPNASDPISLAIESATKLGVVCVAAAGNSGPFYFTGSSPASSISSISVGAIDRNNNLALFSSWGPTYTYLGYPSLVAPGVNVISTNAKESAISREMQFLGDYFDFDEDADYVPLTGTSMACPMVAGACAILLQAYPSLTPEAVKIALLKGAKKLSNEDGSEFLESGAGLINVSASLNYLAGLGPNKNATAKIFPDLIPFKPYDLVQFPGDLQKFNLTVISGKDNSLNLLFPSSINGLKVSVDKSNLIFNEAGVKFVTLGLELEDNAEPGTRTFLLNLTVGAQIYDVANITINVRLPKRRVLMESFHGMNDWMPQISFPQIEFYDAIRDLYDMNISVDFRMEHWTPDYNKDEDNELLTDELVFQYDLVILQNPILPYAPSEIDCLKRYFESGGNILLLGTRYQNLCVENVNELISELGVGIQIAESNVVSDSWVGLGAIIYGQDVNIFNSTEIFNGVNKFYWYYGCNFETSLSARAIASINGKTVAAVYNGSAQGKGNFLAFGDLYWLAEDYKLSSYAQDHHKLLENVMNFLVPLDLVSLSIKVSAFRSTSSRVNITIYAVNQTTELPVQSSILNSFVRVSIKGDAYYEEIDAISLSDGISINTTYNLPAPSRTPYTIFANLTVNSKVVNVTSKVLFYEVIKVPRINSVSISEDTVTRTGSDKVNINATLNGPNCIVNAYMALYSRSYYNSDKSKNKTISLTSNLNSYSATFAPVASDPSGYAILYILPKNQSSNYLSWSSPRISFQILNNAPQFDMANSFMTYEEAEDVPFQSLTGLYFKAFQDSEFEFEVLAKDSVSYEDSSSEIRIFVNFFVCLITFDGRSSIIYPKFLLSNEMHYDSNKGKSIGTFTIPSELTYDSIAGTKTISSETDYADGGFYIGILRLYAWDSEGNYAYFTIFVDISEAEESEEEVSSPNFIVSILLIGAALILIGTVVAFLIYSKIHSRKKNHF